MGASPSPANGLPPGPHRQSWSLPDPQPSPGAGRRLRVPAELGPSLGLPTGQEEDLFPRGEGLAVLVPRDLRARVSVDSAGEGDAAVEDGRDLLHLRARDSRWDCPRGHRDKDRHVRPHLGRGTESYSVTHRALRAPGAPSDDTARQPLFAGVTSQRRAQGLGDRREPLCQGPPAGSGQNQNTHLCESWTFAPVNHSQPRPKAELRRTEVQASHERRGREGPLWGR